MKKRNPRSPIRSPVSLGSTERSPKHLSKEIGQGGREEPSQKAPRAERRKINAVYIVAAKYKRKKRGSRKVVPQSVNKTLKKAEEGEPVAGCKKSKGTRP